MASCTLSIKAVPGSSRDEIQGWLGESLKVRIQAPPTDGKANAALCSFMAESLGLPRNAVSLAGGNSSRQKRISISGLDLREVRERLQPALERASGKTKRNAETGE